MKAAPQIRLLFVLTCILLIAKGLMLAGCANIIPPSGGPRDSLPPQLLNATPADSTTNFRSDRVVLTFDEYIKLENVQGNILFTPTFETNPVIEEKSKTLTIRFKDPLLPNTTYTLNFGNTIRDVNENNILRDFTYTFSTGPTLDSLQLNGKVLLAQTGKADSNLVVVLYKDLSDSAVVRNRPLYITRVDAAGNFHFKNLPSGTFAIYALGDALAKRYQDTTKLFAFADAPVVPGQTSNITLYAFQKTRIIPQTINTSASLSKADRRLQFASSVNGNQQDLLNDLVLTFTIPLKTFDSTRLSLSTDSSFTKVPYTVSLDAAKRELRIKTPWQEATRYNLVLNRDFAEDTLGRKLLKSDTLHFIAKKTSDYGKLTVRFKNIDAARNPVLQFIQGDNVVFSAPVKSGIFTQLLFAPGEYQLRLLYDTNGNGKWDAGQFFGTKRQPEIAVPIERKLTVRAGADNDIEIQL